MPNRTILFIFLLSVSGTGLTQTYINLKSYNIDSMLAILPGQEGKERVNTLSELAFAFSYEEFDSSTRFAEEALILANELNYEEGIAGVYRNLGYMNFFTSNYAEALNNFF